jgi:hypothetical protein
MALGVRTCGVVSCPEHYHIMNESPSLPTHVRGPGLRHLVTATLPAFLLNGPLLLEIRNSLIRALLALLSHSLSPLTLRLCPPLPSCRTVCYPHSFGLAFYSSSKLTNSYQCSSFAASSSPLAQCVATCKISDAQGTWEKASSIVG